MSISFETFAEITKNQTPILDYEGEIYMHQFFLNLGVVDKYLKEKGYTTREALKQPLGVLADLNFFIFHSSLDIRERVYFIDNHLVIYLKIKNMDADSSGEKAIDIINRKSSPEEIYKIYIENSINNENEYGWNAQDWFSIARDANVQLPIHYKITNTNEEKVDAEYSITVLLN